MMLISYCGGIGLIWTEKGVINCFLVVSSLHRQTSVSYNRLFKNKCKQRIIFDYLH